MTETVIVKVGIGELNGLSGIVIITLACIDKEMFSYWLIIAAQHGALLCLNIKHYDGTNLEIFLLCKDWVLNQDCFHPESAW